MHEIFCNLDGEKGTYLAYGGLAPRTPQSPRTPLGTSILQSLCAYAHSTSESWWNGKKSAEYSS